MELKSDHSRIILTADKEVAMVVMDRQDYVNKAKELLGDQHTYRPISKDPTSKLNNELIQIFKDCKSYGQVNQATYKRLYPTCTIPAKFYGLPKIHKQGTLSGPLCPAGTLSHMV